MHVTAAEASFLQVTTLAGRSKIENLVVLIFTHFNRRTLCANSLPLPPLQ
jgi:hypothetical protein